MKMNNQFSCRSQSQKFKSFGRSSAIAAVLMTGLLGACDINQPEANVPETTNEPVATEPYNDPAVNERASQTGTTTTPTQTNESTEIEEVVDNQNDLIGRTVTVQGEVEEVLGPNVYRVQDEGEVFGDSILVVNVEPGQAPVVEDENVQVIGEVRQFVVADFERDYDLTWDLDIKQKIEAEYEGKPVIVSKSIDILSPTEVQ